MEKSLSEGVLGTPLRRQVTNLNELQKKRWQLTQSICDLERDEQVLDFFLLNQKALNTSEGKNLAKKTINKIARITGKRRERKDSSNSVDDLKVESVKDKENLLDEKAINETDR